MNDSLRENEVKKTKLKNDGQSNEAKKIYILCLFISLATFRLFPLATEGVSMPFLFLLLLFLLLFDLHVWVCGKCKWKTH